MKIRKFALLSVSAVSLSAPALAQETPAVSEIVVTAQRRAERAQDVPIAMSVVGGEQIDRQRINNINDLSRVAASLQLAPQPGGTGGAGYIRGIGTFSRSRAAEPSVGIVVDGVVQGLTNVRNLSDIARVEVLRGPQGTLFGQSVSAGVINMTTVAPDPSRLSGKVSVELSDDGTAGSEFGRQVGRAALNVPLASNVAVRVTGYGSRTQGVLENAYTGKSDVQKEAGVRGRLMGEFGDVTVNLAAEYNYDRTTNGGFPVIWRITPSAPKSAALFAACGVTPGIDNHTICSDGVSVQRFVIQGYSGQIDYDAGPLALTSITAYRTLKSRTQNDIDNLPSALQTTEQQSGLASDYTQFTQELRAATDPGKPLSLTMGAFYMRTIVDNRVGPSVGVVSRDYVGRAGLPIATCFPVATVPECGSFTAPAARNVEQVQNFGNTNGSVFGELRYHQGPFTGFVGGRLISAKVTLDGFSGARLQNLRDSDMATAWRAGVQYAFDRDLMLYATVARGYKSAQIAPIQGNSSARVVNPEIPTSYEVGLKSSLFNRRVNFNITGFYARVEDYQTSNCTIDSTNLVTCVPLNIDKVVSKGIETDISGRISDHWTVNANAVYNIVKYPAGFLADDGTNLGGQQVARAPKFVATFSSDYAVPLKGDMEAFLSFDLSYKSRERLGTLSASDLYTFKANPVLGGRVGVRVDKSWSVALFANNITGANQPMEFSQLVNQYPDPRGSVYGVFQTARSLRLIGLQAQYQF